MWKLNYTPCYSGLLQHSNLPAVCMSNLEKWATAQKSLSSVCTREKVLGSQPSLWQTGPHLKRHLTPHLDFTKKSVYRFLIKVTKPGTVSCSIQTALQWCLVPIIRWGCVWQIWKWRLVRVEGKLNVVEEYSDLELIQAVQPPTRHWP